MSCTFRGRRVLEHSLSEARLCLERIAWREVDARDVAAGPAWRS